MASFRRKVATEATTIDGEDSVPQAVCGAFLTGTKPFLNGQTLISSGLTQLDTILGGGWLMGTMALFDVSARNDMAGASSALVDDFHRYFLAEGVVAGQRVVLVSEDAAEFVNDQIPMELSLAQKQIKQLTISNDKESLMAGGDSSLASESPSPLTIAWQYQKYVPTSTSTASESQRFCHSYDLSRSMHRELLDVNPPLVLDTLKYMNESNSSPSQVYNAMLQAIQSSIQQASACVVRIVVRELGSSQLAGPPTNAHMRALFMFLRDLRVMVVQAKAVMCQLSGYLYAFPKSFVHECQHMCDYVMEIKSFMGERDLVPAELTEFDGVLDIQKQARVHSLACHSMDTVKFGIKRERRKLKIEKFHLPPEGSRNTSSVTSKTTALVGNTWKKTLVGCGSGGLSTDMDPLDF